MPMPASMAESLEVGVYMMRYLDTHSCTYVEAMKELKSKFPEAEVDLMLIEWILGHTHEN